jgi:hypothetical protein
MILAQKEAVQTNKIRMTYVNPPSSSLSPLIVFLSNTDLTMLMCKSTTYKKHKIPGNHQLPLPISWTFRLIWPTLLGDNFGFKVSYGTIYLQRFSKKHRVWTNYSRHHSIGEWQQSVPMLTWAIIRTSWHYDSTLPLVKMNWNHYCIKKIRKMLYQVNI